MLRTLRAAAVAVIVFTIILGLVYPAAIAVLSRFAFSEAAAGSLIREGSRSVGSALIGQPFSAPEYFWGRPSATAGMPYNAVASGATNLGPSNPVWVEAVREQVEALRAADPGNAAPVPVDLVTSSASGLDPHISPEAAFYQVARVARARGVSEEQVRGLVSQHVEGPLFGLFGEPRVNVLLLNLALKRLGEVGRESMP